MLALDSITNKKRNKKEKEKMSLYGNIVNIHTTEAKTLMILLKLLIQTQFIY